MLLQFLKKSRTRRTVAKGKDIGSTGDSLDIVSSIPQFILSFSIGFFFFKAIDTVLVKLFVEFDKTTELHALLNESNDVFISEVEPIFEQNQHYDALCTLYKQKGNDLKLLDTWAQ